MFLPEGSVYVVKDWASSVHPFLASNCLEEQAGWGRGDSQELGLSVMGLVLQASRNSPGFCRYEEPSTKASLASVCVRPKVTHMRTLFG